MKPARARPTTLRGSFIATWLAMLADPGAVLLLFVGGVIYSFFYPLPYSREHIEQVPVAVVDQDHSTTSRQITRYAAAHPSLHVVSTPQGDLREAQDLLWKNQIGGMLFIPAGLQDKLLGGRQAEVTLSGNGVYMLMDKAALNGLAEAVGTVSAGVEVQRLRAATPSSAQALAQRQPVAVEAVALFNVRDGYGAYIVPGVMVVIVQQTLLMAVALLMGTWRERAAQPVAGHVAAYFGMLLAFASVAFANCLYFFGFVLWWQDYPRAGQAGSLLLFSALFALCVAALGMALGGLFRTRERSVQLLLCTALPALFLSGLPWPVQAMPEVLQVLRWGLPSTAGIQGFLALNQLGASVQDIATEASVLLGLLALCVAAGLWCWRGRQ